MMLAALREPRFNWSMLKWLVVVGVIAGCTTRENPAYCDESADCKNGFVCNLTTHGCEATSTDDAAVDSGPGSCALDDECASGVCRDDASCEIAENVLYVSTDGISAGTCSSEMRCDITYALSQVTASRSTLRLANGMYEFASDFVIDRDMPDVTIVGGRGAVLRRAATGVMMDVRGAVGSFGPRLTLRGMTINKGLNCYWAGLRLQRALLDSPPADPIPWIAATACTVVVSSSELRNSPVGSISGEYSDLEMVDSSVTMSSGFGIALSGANLGRGTVRIVRSTIAKNFGIGVRVHNATSFTLERSLVSDNHLGGVESVGHPFEVTNNYVVLNGSQGNTLGVDSSHFGGLHIAGAGTSRLLFNTIAFNNSDPAALYAGGVFCDAGTTGSNLISWNQRGNEAFPRATTGGNCDFTGSIIDQSFIAMDSKFIDAITANFHISAASPAVNAGNGAPLVPIDFDGDERSDGAADVGADELP